MTPPVGDIDDVLIGSVDGISVDVSGDWFDFPGRVCNLDTHSKMCLGILLPNLCSPQIDKSLRIQDSILTLLGDRLGDDGIVEIEPRETERTVDTVDNNLGSELEVVVDISLYQTVVHNLLYLTRLSSSKVILVEVILNLFWRCIGMEEILQVIVNLGELERCLLICLSLEVKISDDGLQDTVLLPVNSTGSADYVTLVPPLLFENLIMFRKQGDQSLRTNVELSHQCRIQ